MTTGLRSSFAPFFVIITSFYMDGCSHLATTTELIPYPRERVIAASIEVADTLGMTRTIGPLDATVYARDAFIYEVRVLPGADLYVEKPYRNFLNNTMSIGALRFDPEGLETRATSIFGTPAGDPLANSRLFLELTRQQILLDKSLQMPTENPQKETWTYVAYNTLSPIISTGYLIKDNPLVSREFTPYLYMQNAAGDVIMVASILASFGERDPKNRQSAIIAGVSIGFLWRVFTLFNLVDLDDYNDLARTPYNLKAAAAR